MKIAILSESSADEAAIRVLLNSIKGLRIESVGFAFRSRGWTSVLGILSTTIKHLHYQTDVDGSVVVADSDDAPIHQSIHDTAGNQPPDCRYCALRAIGQKTLSEVRPRPSRRPLDVAYGIATPAIEAWLRCDVDLHVTEAAWTLARSEGRVPFTRKDLKRDLYGIESPSLEIETRVMTEAATRLAANLAHLERQFPMGFGTLARAIRVW